MVSQILLEKIKLIPLIEPPHFVRRLSARVTNDWDQENRVLKRFIVNPKYQFLYCPIHRNASTSMLAAMLAMSDSQRKENLLKQSELTIRLYVELNYSLASYSYAEAEQMIASYFKFVIVRNPWARLVSTYCRFFADSLGKGRISEFSKILAQSIYGESTLELIQSITFEDFVEYAYITDDQSINPHCASQYRFLGGIQFDCIARLENLAADVESICTRLKLPLELPGLKKTKYVSTATYSQDLNYSRVPATELKKMKDGLPAYPQFYTPKLVEKVRERYARSIELFGYEFV